jgi:hypothetical protein
LIVAIAGILLLHDPPGVGSLIEAPLGTHTPAGPVIGEGVWLTVTDIVLRQVVGKVYVTRAVPGTIPVMLPEVGLIVAVVNGATVQVPPGEDELRVNDSPVHTWLVPVRVPGSALTVTNWVAEQPATV